MEDGCGRWKLADCLGDGHGRVCHEIAVIGIAIVEGERRSNDRDTVVDEDRDELRVGRFEDRAETVGFPIVGSSPQDRDMQSRKRFDHDLVVAHVTFPLDRPETRPHRGKG